MTGVTQEETEGLPGASSSFRGRSQFQESIQEASPSGRDGDLQRRFVLVDVGHAFLRV